VLAMDNWPLLHTVADTELAMDGDTTVLRVEGMVGVADVGD
jgi:hypothetical protein